MGNEFHGDPIPDLGKFCIGPAGFVHALAGDLREKFRVGGPDAEEMFILHRHASRNQTLGLVGRELLVEVSIPAQLRQVHRGVLIESFMAYSLRLKPQFYEGRSWRFQPTGPPSAQMLIMISHPSVQEEGAISRRLEHKSFISKPLESNTRFIALSDGVVTGLA